MNNPLDQPHAMLIIYWAGVLGTMAWHLTRHWRNAEDTKEVFDAAGMPHGTRYYLASFAASSLLWPVLMPLCALIGREGDDK